MNISKILIHNFKTYKGTFLLTLNKGINVIVGDNEAGKSTIIEAIHLALTGLLNGRYLRNELTQYIFNNEVIEDYLKSLTPGNTPQPLPYILIEIYMDGEGLTELHGDGNSLNEKCAGVSLLIAFNEKYRKEYASLVTLGNIMSLPIEYYDINWSSFSWDEGITPRLIPIKSALIDSSNNRFQNGSDIYISRIIKDLLEPSEAVEISQAHRKMKDSFMGEAAVKKINEKIKSTAKISEKKVEISVELSSKNAWENSLITYLEDVPFHFSGKGEQAVVKTRLALGHKKAQEANIILLEEPENHLSHSKLNELISHVKADRGERQVFISTHSSFVANKLGLDHLILLNNKKTVRLNELSPETKAFFEKLSGYDTLRLVLCKKAILVEGDSDELIVQKAYTGTFEEKLPIEDGIDVISVGTSFLRFLEIANKLDKKVAVVTDTDGDLSALNTKYSNYLGANKKANIEICFDSIIDPRTQIQGKDFNFNTLEPKFFAANGLKKMNSILGTSYETEENMLTHLRANKTDSALKIFSSQEIMAFPSYIQTAINF